VYFKESGQEGYTLFTRVMRRPNPRYWKWIMNRRRREVQDAIFGWLEGCYVLDGGRTTDIEWVSILDDGRYRNDWKGITARMLWEWGSTRTPKYVVQVLYAFEKYCDRHFTHDGEVKRRPPVVPPYPGFEDFLRDYHKPKRTQIVSR